MGYKSRNSSGESSVLMRLGRRAREIRVDAIEKRKQELNYSRGERPKTYPAQRIRGIRTEEIERELAAFRLFIHLECKDK